MRTYLPGCVLGLSALLVVGLVACGETTNPTSPSGSSGSSGRGTLAVRLTDLPYQAGALLVTFSDVSAHLSGEGGGWQTVLPEGATRTCDLKLLEDTAFDLIDRLLDPGDYTQLRLTVETATLYFEPTPAHEPCVSGPLDFNLRKASVEVNSGEIKLNRPFSLMVGGTTTIELDFDGDRSVREMGKIGPAHPEDGRYRMTPVISVVSVDEESSPFLVGTLRGF